MKLKLFMYKVNLMTTNCSILKDLKRQTKANEKESCSLHAIELFKTFFEHEGFSTEL